MTRRFLFYVYILASNSGTLYVGMSNNLPKRVDQHKRGICDGFTQKYGVNRLVYYETFSYVGKAITREKQLKGWRREKKVALIEKMNPSWKDLSREWYREAKIEMPR